VFETHSERVLVVRTELFHQLGHFQGFKGDVRGYVDELLRPENTSYQPRADVEKNPDFKQLIPYVIFAHVDEDGRQTVFQYTRGTGQGESRLHKKRSVGIGGHISAIDERFFAGSPYDQGMRRELEEEVEIHGRYTPQRVGMINDDETEVGRVHLGIVHLFKMDQPDVRPLETEILDSGFRPVQEILADLAEFETWSQLCMREWSKICEQSSLGNYGASDGGPKSV
jgi:predicted NUDIX family phosphoesterase